MPEQQKDTQYQKPQTPPNLSGAPDKDASIKSGLKTPQRPAPKKTDDEDEDGHE